MTSDATRAGVGPLEPSVRATAGYREYMASEDWRRNRQPALDRARGACERCGSTPLWLEVHHKHYLTLGREAPEDLEALCHECHLIADRERAEESRSRVARAAFNGWATKVYGEDWEMFYDDQMERRYDEFVDRKERMGDW